MAAFLHGLIICLQPVNLLLMWASAIVGIIFGAIPGLSGGLGMTLLLPLTFGMNTANGFSMLLGMYVGGISGSFIASILVGIPGSASSIATCFDGYPMHLKGETSKALGLGIIASFIGTFFSVIIAAILSTPLANLALMLGPWEYFSLCLCAVVLVAALSKGSTVKGLLSTGVGLLVASVGLDPVTASSRFSFGMVYTKAGINIVSVMLGIFAIQQIMSNFAHGNQTLPDVKTSSVGGIGVKLSDFANHIATILRSFFIGLWIGFLPGLGSSLSNLVAYAQEKAVSKHPEKFGTGITEGVLASETANNASIGGALIPTMALGIPGDAPTALLLSGLIIHGLQPGPLFISSNPDLSFMIFAAVLLCAVFVVILQLFTKRWFPYLLKAPYNYLYTIILVMCFVGAYTASSTMFNVVMMILFAAIGMLFEIADIPTSPMILGYVLFGNLESYFRKGISYSTNGIITFFTRPVSLLFILIAVFSVIWPWLKRTFFPGKTRA